VGIYAVTGSGSGMGKAASERLIRAGHTVIGIDLRDADVVADLSTADGRVTAADEVLRLADHRLDGAVMSAGMGPTPGRERAIAELNVLGTVDPLLAWRDALARSGNGKVVVFGSNSSTTTPFLSRSGVRALTAGDIENGVKKLTRISAFAAPATYAASKVAVTRWCRRTAVTPEWAGAGIRLNAIAPGPVHTPMLQSQIEGNHGNQLRRFPVPIGSYGDPSEVSEWVFLMLSSAANYMVGSVIFIDGGTDAYFRSDDWPTAVSVLGVPAYLRLMHRHQKASKRMT
jgi:NAD(P)-dependent dehydrogenase (short-subunit alcohol dehydrogenase family)